MANQYRRLAAMPFVAALLAAGHAHAQQTPSLDNAVATATRWAAQADSGQADAMWKSSGQIMQKSVSQADWAKYLDGVKKQLGATQSREWAQIGRVESPQGLPPGQYLNVVFLARHANAPALETVSMAQLGANWVPVGYIVRPVQQQPAAPAPAAAPVAPTKPAK